MGVQCEFSKLLGVLRSVWPYPGDGDTQGVQIRAAGCAEMKGAAQYWTLTFRDADLERNYRDQIARRSRLHYRIVVAACIVAWHVVIPFDYLIGGTPENANLLTSLRLVATPFIIISFAMGWLKDAQFARFWQVTWVGLFMLGLALILLMISTVPDPAAHATEFQAAGFMLVMLIGMLAVPVRFAYAVISNALVCVVAVGVLVIHTDHAAIFALLIVVAYGLGITSVLTTEQSRRRGFMLAKLLDTMREKTDALLHNMVPASIAAQLKGSTERIAEHHDEATVLFADIVGFTPMSEKMSAQEIVSLLDNVFSRFDAQVDKLGLEKIKTIGDGYMAVGGVPDPRDDHVEAVANLAFAMTDIVAAIPPIKGKTLTLRVGIHSGPLVAGVIGTRKLVYDLWGDTVNTASRMESHAEDGTIHVTASVADRLQADYVLEERGEVDIKGKGVMHTFVLLGRRITDCSVSIGPEPHMHIVKRELRKQGARELEVESTDF